jgi:hypothetical protein
MRRAAPRAPPDAAASSRYDRDRCGARAPDFLSAGFQPRFVTQKTDLLSPDLLCARLNKLCKYAEAFAFPVAVDSSRVDQNQSWLSPFKAD